MLAYKKKRKIINYSYQTSEDNVVGKMKIAALDEDMLARQKVPSVATYRVCTKGICVCMPDKPEPPLGKPVPPPVG